MTAHYRICPLATKEPRSEMNMAHAKNSHATLGALLAIGQAKLQDLSDSSRLDAELLLQLATGLDRATLYANPERILADQSIDQYLQLIETRVTGMPVPYLTGEREFWSLPLAVNQHVLIPRPETETLVECALQRIPLLGNCRVLELGTGSGAIAAALASERPGCRFVATDNSLGALEVAAANFARLCPGRIELMNSDWYAHLSADCEYSLIVSNPPYIAEDHAVATDRELTFEPRDALYSGPDGLNAIHTIIDQAPAYLMTTGWLMLEHGFNQNTQVAELLQSKGFSEIKCYFDSAGLPRVTEGRWA
jgi:release factor glutamine methyltransferase